MKVIGIFILSSILCQTRAKISPVIEYKLSNWSNIVPHGLEEIPYDAEVCQVIYPSGAEVSLGNYLSSSDTHEQPSTVTWTADPSSYYYLIFADIDAPSRQRPTMRPTFHWMVGNIRGNNVTAGDTIFVYRHPLGSHSSGLHRYLFLIYEQSGYFNYTMFKANAQRRWNLDVRVLSTTLHSKGPIAVNFFHYRVYPNTSSHAHA